MTNTHINQFLPFNERGIEVGRQCINELKSRTGFLLRGGGQVSLGMRSTDRKTVGRTAEERPLPRQSCIRALPISLPTTAAPKDERTSLDK